MKPKEAEFLFITLLRFFYSGEQHAGENLEAILRSRDRHLDPIIQMCDALSRNLPKEIKTVVCYCLAHGRRQCVDVEPFFPEEAGFVIEKLAEVYQNESKIQMSTLRIKVLFGASVGAGNLACPLV